MGEEYFHRLTRHTPTRFWINNPTLEEADLAIAAGAISCTTNPAFCAHMLKAELESAYTLTVIEEVVQQTSEDQTAAELVMQRLVKRVAEKFLPLYERTIGLEGFVSIQGNPHGDEDSNFIIDEALRFRKLEKNLIAKIPLTQAGIKAIEFLIAENLPIIATEVFAVEQAIQVCDLYLQVSEKTGCSPPFYVTHITGIFDEYLANYVNREGIEVSRETLRQAGCAVARKQYHILQKRNYPVTMMDGGARGTHHFTEFVGGAVHITINWSTAKELIQADPPVVARMGSPVPQHAIDELLAKLPDFRKAYLEGGLATEEFQDYGPLQHFRGMFVAGWDTLVQRVKERRARLVSHSLHH